MLVWLPVNKPRKVSMMSRLIPVIIMIICITGLAACKDDDAGNETADREQLTKMEAEIDGLIGEATCTDARDCRSIAFGDKPCGGPWSYKVYSVTGVDTLQVAGMVDAYNKFNTVLNNRYGWMSDCMVVMPPNIDCMEGRCVAIE